MCANMYKNQHISKVYMLSAHISTLETRAPDGFFLSISLDMDIPEGAQFQNFFISVNKIENIFLHYKWSVYIVFCFSWTFLLTNLRKCGAHISAWKSLNISLLAVFTQKLILCTSATTCKVYIHYEKYRFGVFCKNSLSQEVLYLHRNQIAYMYFNSEHNTILDIDKSTH